MLVSPEYGIDPFGCQKGDREGYCVAFWQVDHKRQESGTLSYPPVGDEDAIYVNKELRIALSYHNVTIIQPHITGSIDTEHRL